MVGVVDSLKSLDLALEGVELLGDILGGLEGGRGREVVTGECQRPPSLEIETAGERGSDWRRAGRGPSEPTLNETNNDSATVVTPSARPRSRSSAERHSAELAKGQRKAVAVRTQCHHDYYQASTWFGLSDARSEFADLRSDASHRLHSLLDQCFSILLTPGG